MARISLLRIYVCVSVIRGVDLPARGICREHGDRDGVWVQVIGNSSGDHGVLEFIGELLELLLGVFKQFDDLKFQVRSII